MYVAISFNVIENVSGPCIVGGKLAVEKKIKSDMREKKLSQRMWYYLLHYTIQLCDMYKSWSEGLYDIYHLLCRKFSLI